MTSSTPFEMTLDLNVLNHLGIGLYSNIPAVISEVVANAWDADASKVTIDIDRDTEVITITDDGCGMTVDEVNGRYLRVGYRKREHVTFTDSGRHVMGRKGIGKLALFSVAKTIEVHTATGQGDRCGMIMRADGIEQAMNDGGSYYPEPVAVEEVAIEQGTLIKLSDLKMSPERTEGFLRRRLARRFSIIGPENGFAVEVNGHPLSVEDRDYFKKIEYLWCIGEDSEKYATYCTNKRRYDSLDGVVDDEWDFKVTGWVGTFDTQKSIDDGNNTLALLAWGKLVHEDLLKDIKDGGIYTKYIIGEIRADFLDYDNLEDMSTSDRQHLREGDPRFEMLRDWVHTKVLRTIESRWGDWRKDDATETAQENPAIKEWYEGLKGDNRKYAQRLFAKIESFPVSDPEYKKELYRNGIVAFETLALNQNLSALESLQGVNDLDALNHIFQSIDSLEQVHYHRIANGRLAVIQKLAEISDAGAKEAVFQEHLFNHLWLLDPSWERATGSERMEERVTTEFAAVTARLSQEERDGRVDIRYRTTAGKHVIIELKRYSRTVSAVELAGQVQKYRMALKKCLRESFSIEDPDIEVVCVVGSQPTPLEEPQTVRDTLAAQSARYVTYDELINHAQHAYSEYIEARDDVSRVLDLIERV